MRWRLHIFFIGLLVICLGCDHDPGVLGLGSNFSSDFGMMVVDTTTVQVSTVLLDSIPTSSTGSLLMGGYSDPKLGNLTAKGYIQVTNPTWTPATVAFFDSLVLRIAHSGYYYGDTTQAQTIEVHRVTKDFKTYALPFYWYNEGQYSALYKAASLYNTTKTPVESTPLGSRQVIFRPNAKDTLTIRLSDALGKEWLTSAQAQAPDLVETARFLTYFKGVSIENASAQPAVVVGLNTDGMKIRLYYKEYSADKLTQKYQDFAFSSSLFNYSSITADRSATKLKDIATTGEVISTASDDQVYVQAGTGLVTKIRFPHVHKTIDGKGTLLVNQAQLLIEPVKDSFDKNRPYPKTLTIFKTDRSNLPLAQLSADYNPSAGQSASYTEDKEYQTSSGYTFNITQYVQNLVGTEGNTDNGLLLMPPGTELTTKVNKIYLGVNNSGTKYRVKLKIWYTRKSTEQ
ncbi:DUF4270 family protein [Chryseolinea soli]|uniref:DUF4270 family protein n=1 Tax=Chryseolinea soli TaxID=2321403 RepID=A0A385SG59_9BACT|nr:DUF4270 family protein [Chryseolinea soli]AYB29441.1 DUF4270 family protein [Chryseolinea soli]